MPQQTSSADRTTASAQPSLHETHCQPRKGAAHKVAAAEAARLLAQLPGWQAVAEGGAIEKTYTFENYYQTLAFVNALAFIAHREDHHPDLGVHYDRCVVRFSTHDVGGLSMNDFICAAKAERLRHD